jgi:hypothetical protein
MATPPLLVHRLTSRPDGTVSVSQHPVSYDTWNRILAVLAHVGKSFAFSQGPYPDATARRALGALTEAGLAPSPPVESDDA